MCVSLPETPGYRAPAHPKLPVNCGRVQVRRVEAISRGRRRKPRETKNDEKAHLRSRHHDAGCARGGETEHARAVGVENAGLMCSFSRVMRLR